VKSGDLVRLVLDDSIGIICRVEEIPAEGVYDSRTRYWTIWHNGQLEWSWGEEVEVIQCSQEI
jgi:hypothetical protein